MYIYSFSASNVMQRTEFLEKTIGTLPLEEKANENAKLLLGIGTAVFISFTVLEILTYFLYNSKVITA